MQPIFEHSVYWLLLAAPLAALVGWWIYWFRNKWEADRFVDWSGSLKTVAGALRALVLFALIFLLLEPFITNLINDLEKPLLLIYSDVTESVTEDERIRFEAWFDSKEEFLEEKYVIHFRRFGSEVANQEDSLSNIGLNTDYSTVIESVNEDHYNQNIGAIVVASDGIQNLGQDPRYQTMNNAAPLYVFAQGDSSIQTDFEITEVLNNDLVFLGNKFQIKVRYKAKRMQGNLASLAIMRDGKKIDGLASEMTDAKEVSEVLFELEADQLGLNRYTISIEPHESEKNISNNSAETFIDVLDNRTQVTIIAKAPHPDIAAIKTAIESNDQYEIHVHLLADWDEDLQNVDLAILHGLPTDPNDLNKIKGIRDQQIPVLSIVTSGISWLHFQRLELGLDFKTMRITNDETSAWVNEGFNLFKAPTNDNLNRFPPLNVVFGDYAFSGGGQVLLNQRIGSINSERSLMGFTSANNWKRAVLLGEGWWKWRLFERMQFDSDWTDKLMVKTAQYLALKQKRTRLSIDAPEKIDEGLEIKFEGEFYNESYELNNDGELSLVLSDSNGIEQSFRFQNNGLGYKLNVGALAPGSYKWKAEINTDGVAFNQNGEFIVMENKAEFARTEADFNFLTQWSNGSDGKVFYKGMEGGLFNTLQSLDTAKPIIHTTKEWQSIIEWKWILFLLALLVTIEWFIRKYNGYY